MLQKLRMSGTAIVLLVAISQSAFASHGKSHWGYTGHDGPTNWGKLSHDYQTCKSGKHQSPININGIKPLNLKNIKFHYQAGAADVVDNGHSIQVNVKPGNYIVADGKRYNLLQFHFHSPSEHRIHGKAADMVVHMVHQAADGQLGVVAVLMNRGESNSEISQIWQHLPKHAGEHFHFNAKINPADLLPAHRLYYNYSGSLTTPPCSENVNWMLMQDPITVSRKQLNTFHTVFNHNVRPIQPINGREVDLSQSGSM